MIDTRTSPLQEELLPLGSAVPGTVSWSRKLRRLIFGTPISSENMEHTLLPKRLALPVFASDAISSVAYATQQIILVLGASGLYLEEYRSQYASYTLLLSSLIILLLAIVVMSYWQTIFAYPSGGGSYIVSKDNLGALPGLIAAAALLIDYVLTVSVSIAAGVQNLASVPVLEKLHVGQNMELWCLFFIALLTLANLRGLKESGSLFAVFTYGFVVMCYALIGVAIVGPFLGLKPHMQEMNAVYHQWPVEMAAAKKAAGNFSIVVLLSAFANGCSAMTGTEAVSNGIPAFKHPKSKNAALTLVAMGVILGTVFIGVSWLAMHLHVVYFEHNGRTAPAVIDQISGAIFGKTYHESGLWFVGYYLTQFFTAMILVLAANTSYADFPRLASILARDRYVPKQFANLGDKLVFNNGILLLGIFAAVLIVVKKGNVDLLIPMYAIGVFTAFTLSQCGMVQHWRKLRDRGWMKRAVINGIGAFATLIVLIDIAAEKFEQGAWVVMLLAAGLVLLFQRIHIHYLDVAQQLKMVHYRPPNAPFTNTVLVLIPTLHRGIMPAIEYARSLSPDCRAVHVETDPERTPQLKSRWEEWGGDVPLVILNSPFRSLISPLMRYLDAVNQERRNHKVTLVIPEYVPTKGWQNLLHGNAGLLLKIKLLSRRDVVVANVRYYLENADAPPPADALAEENLAIDNHHSDHGGEHA